VPATRCVRNVLMTCQGDEGLGGLQVVFRELVRQLEENGRRVHLLYPAPLPGLRLVEKVNSWGRRAYYCAMPAFIRKSAILTVLLFLAYLPVVFLHLRRLIRRHKIDVINCHYLTPYFIHLVITARLLRVPVVISVHGAEIDSFGTEDWMYKALLRAIMCGANRIVACSRALAKQTSDTFPDMQGKISWVHNALTCARPEGTHSPSVSQPFILCVCRHVYKKGVDTLLRAFALICDDAPGVSLVLVGDGPLFAEHKLLAAKLQIGDRVVFMGEVAHADVMSFFSKCAVYVLPSRAEPFGLVLLEAASYKKPIVCTSVGGVPEIITHGVNGLMCAPDDPAGMAAAVLSVLQSPNLARRLGCAAYETLLARFLWKDRVQDYIAIFEGATGASLMGISSYASTTACHRDRITSGTMR
jgi:glycogen synthase